MSLFRLSHTSAGVADFGAFGAFEIPEATDLWEKFFEDFNFKLLKTPLKIPNPLKTSLKVQNPLKLPKNFKALENPSKSP